MIPTPPDAFEEWLRIPVTGESGDPRFRVRRARPEEFDRIYDLVDAAFGKRRPREQYDWLYRRNPTGTARCWIVVERESGAFLKSGANFPWPIWRGAEALHGGIGGDAATRPDWQRRGLSAIRRRVAQTHPWFDEICGISGPNAGSRAAILSAGDRRNLLGRLRGGVAVLDSRATAEEAGLPPILARPLGLASDLLLRGLFDHSRTARDQGLIRIEPIDRFSSDFDTVTRRCMEWPRFWCPHNSEFLNWRYLDHPVEEYRALALFENEEPRGYAVLRLGEQGATLSEFAVEAEPRSHARALLGRALALARQAGSAHVNFFSTPGWRHWGLFYRAGFLPYPSGNQMEASGKRFEPEIHDLRNWQILPGDRDYH